MRDKSKWDKMPSLSVIKWMLFVPKVAAVTANMSASEQNFPGKELVDRSTEPWGTLLRNLIQIEVNPWSELDPVSFEIIVINSG